MDLRSTPEQLAFRDEVREFFKTSLPANIKRNQMKGHRMSKEDIVAWQRILTMSIVAGSNEIQHNLIARNVLGL